MAELVSSSKQSVLTFLHKHFPTVTKPVEEPMPQSEEELHGIAAIYQARGLAYDLQGACLPAAHRPSANQPLTNRQTDRPTGHSLS